MYRVLNLTCHFMQHFSNMYNFHHIDSILIIMHTQQVLLYTNNNPQPLQKITHRIKVVQIHEILYKLDVTISSLYFNYTFTIALIFLPFICKWWDLDKKKLGLILSYRCASMLNIVKIHGVDRGCFVYLEGSVQF